MSELVKEFNSYRFKMNKNLLKQDDLVINRMFNLDSKAYQDGALDARTKELLGLVAATTLRCDDCIKYHLQTCYKEGLGRKEIVETLSIAALVGGTVVIPHLRRALEFWEELELE